MFARLDKPTTSMEIYYLNHSNILSIIIHRLWTKSDSNWRSAALILSLWPLPAWNLALVCKLSDSLFWKLAYLACVAQRIAGVIWYRRSIVPIFHTQYDRVLVGESLTEALRAPHIVYYSWNKNHFSIPRKKQNMAAFVSEIAIQSRIWLRSFRKCLFRLRFVRSVIGNGVRLMFRYINNCAYPDRYMYTM